MIRALRRSEDRRKGGCSPSTPDHPVSIPHDIENRGVATGNDRGLNPQIRSLFPPPPQVTGSATLNLSRWRHGFKSRWDYQRKRVSTTSLIGQISGSSEEGPESS